MSNRSFRTSSPIFNVAALAVACATDLRQLRGFSRNAVNATPAPNGYMVSAAGCEQVFDKLPNARTIAQFIRANPLRPGEYFGGWVDENGLTYLDVSVQVESQSDALTLAKVCNQKAIYDLSKRETIYITAPPAHIAHSGQSGLRRQGNAPSYENPYFAYDTETSWGGPNRDTFDAALSDLIDYRASIDKRMTSYDVMSIIANNIGPDMRHNTDILDSVLPDTLAADCW